MAQEYIKMDSAQEVSCKFLLHAKYCNGQCRHQGNALHWIDQEIWWSRNG